MSEITAISASKALGAGVQKVRELRGLSQADLATRMHTREEDIQALEEGVLFFESGYPVKVAAALEVPLHVVVLFGADFSNLSEGDRMITEKLIELAATLIEREPLT